MKKMVIRVLVTDGTGNIYNALIDKGSFRNHPVWASSSGPFLRHIHVHVGGLFTFKCAFFVSETDMSWCTKVCTVCWVQG
jgi:hypothetical protein